MADYFSKLPESLIHHILSFLPFNNEIGRTCVLSKYFNSVWNNYPNLEFSFDNPYWSFSFKNNTNNLNLSLSDLLKKLEQDLLDRIENSLGQCLVRRPFIQQLSLQISSFSALNNLTTKLDGWLGDSVDKNVERLVLSLFLRHKGKAICYSVPHQVLVARRLQVLDLSRCVFNEDNFVRIELPCLEKLCLSYCTFVGNNLLQKILCASPKMKHLSLKHCKGLGEQLQSILLGIQVLELYNCCYKNKYKISSPSLKRLILRMHGSHRLNDIEIDAPNLLSLEFSLYRLRRSNFMFRSWSIPKVEDIRMKLSSTCLGKARRAGLQDLLKKLPNYKDLKLLIFNKPSDCNLIMIMELHHVSFYSIRKLSKNSSFVVISSRDETNLVHKVSDKYLTISMICSSSKSAETFRRKFENWSIVKDKYDHIELVSPSEIQMSFTWESFLKYNSIGVNHSGAIILHAFKGHK